MPRYGWATSELRDAALKYAGQQWPVLPGHFHDRYGCSCGERCEEAGTHPLREHWPTGASSDPDAVREWWSRDPYSILLPTGGPFDVLDVPGAPGRESLLRLEILGYRLGPVAQTEDGRVLIWVKPGWRLPRPAEAPQLYENLGIRYHGGGGYVAAPPSCGARWLNSPGVTAHYLPRAVMLIGTVGYACGEAQHLPHLSWALPVQRTGNQLEQRLA
jgi:hypothetical protein